MGNPKVKTITYEQVTERLLQKFGFLKDWAANLDTKMPPWPCSPTRRLRLLHVAMHLIDFVKITRPPGIIAPKGHSDQIQQSISYRVDKCRIIILMANKRVAEEEAESYCTLTSLPYGQVYMRVSTLIITLR